MLANQYNCYNAQKKYYHSIADEYTWWYELHANITGQKITITTANLGRLISCQVFPGESTRLSLMVSSLLHDSLAVLVLQLPWMLIIPVLLVLMG